MQISYYPTCNSQINTFHPSSVIDGTIDYENRTLIFTAKLWDIFNINSKSFEINFDEIVSIETVNLNAILPYGVLITLACGQEIMLGAYDNKMLKAYIDNVINEENHIPQYRPLKASGYKIAVVLFSIIAILAYIILIYEYSLIS